MYRFITGLRTEIVLNIAGLMIVSTALIGFVVLKVSEQSALDQKVKSARVILNSIQSSLNYVEATVPATDAQSLQRLADIFFKRGGIDTIIIVDREMRIISHSSPDEIGKLYDDEALSRGIAERKVSAIAKGGSVIVSAPLYLRNGVAVGIKIILPAGDVREATAKSQRLLLFYITLNSVILIVFASILLSRTIVRPIDELVKVTEAVASGDFNQRIRVARVNEIGMLAESMNMMTERLRQGKDALEANIRYLEAAHDNLKNAQDDVIRAEKMASVGRLAAGIAHEIGNPLSAILGYTGILQKGVCKEDEADYIRRIELETQRINRIVRSLLDYARPGEFKLVDVNVNDVIKDSIELISAQKRFERVDIKLNLNNVQMVKADPHKLQQVLINLFINAYDAMPDGGPLTVMSGVRGQGAGDWVEVSMTDKGIGMDSEEMEKIFEPFYTTKDPGTGTGLGLSICQRIMESFGGRLEVKSQKGRGSTFSILLPVRED